MNLKELDSLVEKYVESYKNDWYKYDRPRVEKSLDGGEFVIYLRKTGADTLFLKGSEVSFGNYLWNNSAIAIKGRVDHTFHVTQDTIKEISVEETIPMLDSLYKSFPEEYMRYCKESSRWSTLIQWQDWWDKGGKQYWSLFVRFQGEI